ncbi:hypothetical protein [Bradyrhizobium sp. CER78]|uniref:hypothetical protein n=1 Tax=Bradyrhizobium sp. CER78 TaxID=3039162 RepID=UPI00244A0504|nr:hypothetical protein [Bradyrhizobium sp. CER78]MDH2381188.1 hypothetical protein [Bradyrhizobium sp. CER78]
MSDNFSWADKDCVVVPSQDAIAVYANANNDLVIRRERTWDEDEDTFIVISRRYTRTVIEAMERVLKETATPA